MAYKNKHRFALAGLLSVFACGSLVSTAIASGNDSSILNEQKTVISIVRAKGEFGQQLNRHAFASAVSTAVENQVDFLVFVLDSPGGLVEDARQISQVLLNAPSSISIVIYVKRAISASVWILASSDILLFSPTSSSGAAVVYYINTSTGDIEVDKKMISAVAGEVAAIAESNGQPGEVYRAMIDPGHRFGLHWTQTEL